jgi:hypothetical protein
MSRYVEDRPLVVDKGVATNWPAMRFLPAIEAQNLRTPSTTPLAVLWPAME